MAVTLNANTSTGFIATSDTSGVLALQTAGTTAVTVDASQNVGIGTSSPGSFGRFVSKQAADTSIASLGVVAQASTTDTFISLGYSSTSDTCRITASYISTGAFKPISFLTSDVERMRINATAPILCLSGGSTTATGTGIAFPATQSASSDVNTLDDYEEGVFTPNQGGGLTVVGTFASTGSYTKIGRMVTVSGTLSATTSVASSNGGTLFSNLPFTCSASAVGGVADSNGGGGSCLITGTSALSYPARAASPGLYFTATYFV